MTVNVKKLNIVIEDDIGHRYLMPHDDYLTWLEDISEKRSIFEEYKARDPYCYDPVVAEELSMDIDSCYDDLYRLEGEMYYVVLPEDILKEGGD